MQNLTEDSSSSNAAADSCAASASASADPGASAAASAAARSTSAAAGLPIAAGAAAVLAACFVANFAGDAGSFTGILITIVVAFLTLGLLSFSCAGAVVRNDRRRRALATVCGAAGLVCALPLIMVVLLTPLAFSGGVLLAVAPILVVVSAVVAWLAPVTASASPRA